ncbi:hypothetical protein BH23GEM3_BH23GEM3_16130 [soil metagenome]|nr:cytochrome c [Gemmatimonadota bacterium]
MRKSLFLVGTLTAALAVGACNGADDRAAPGTDPATAPAAGSPGAPGAPAAAPVDPRLAAALPPGVTAQMVTEGQQLYATVCVACHGAAGTGTQLGPSLNDQNWIHISGEYDEIVNITATGVARPREYPAPMPPRGGGNFTDEQVRSIAAYVFSLSHRG